MQQNILRHTKKQTLGTHRYGERSYRASHQRGKKPHLMQQSNHCKHKTCCLMRSMNSMLSQAIAMEFTVSQPTTHNSPNLYTYFSSSIFSVWAHSSAWQSDRLITGRPGVQTPLGPLRYWFFLRVQNNKRSSENTRLETEISATEPYQDFLFARNSPVTRERYSTRLRSFFVFIGIEGTTMEERCRKFVEKVKESEEEEENSNIKWAYASVLKFLQHQKNRNRS